MPSVWRQGRPNASRSIIPVSTTILEAGEQFYCSLQVIDSEWISLESVRWMRAV
jgi:hypothetical protein